MSFGHQNAKRILTNPDDTVQSVLKHLCSFRQLTSTQPSLSQVEPVKGLLESERLVCHEAEAPVPLRSWDAQSPVLQVPVQQRPGKDAAVVLSSVGADVDVRELVICVHESEQDGAARALVVMVA